MTRLWLNYVLALLVYAFVLTGAYWAGGLEAEDFTDTGVGCVDDCLEPMDRR